MLKKHVLTQLSPPGPSSGLHRQPGRARAVYTIIDSAMPTPSIRGNIQEISLSTAPWKPIHSFVQPRPPSGIFAQHTELGRAEFVLCLLCNKGAGAGWAGPRQTLGRDGKYLAMSESQMSVEKIILKEFYSKNSAAFASDERGLQHENCELSISMTMILQG